MGCPKCCRKEEWASNRMPEIPLSIINKQEEEVIKLKNQMILNEKLREMVRQEQEAFRKSVLEKSTEEIYGMAQEIAVKEELAAFFSNTEFSAKEARAMLKAGNVLQNIYTEAESQGIIGENLLIHAVSAYRESLTKAEKSLQDAER